MKKLKVTVGKNAPVRSFASLPEEQKDLQRFRKIKAMMCPCCGETMLLVDNVWVCQKCSYCIAQAICYQVRYSGFAIIVDGF